MREKNMFLILLFSDDDENNIKKELQKLYNCLDSKKSNIFNISIRLIFIQNSLMEYNNRQK